MVRVPGEIGDVLASSVQTLGEKADDVRALIPDSWQDSATTVMDHLADSVHDARSRVSTLAKDTSQPLIGADRSALTVAASDRRMKAVGVLLVVSFLVLLRRRRKQRRGQRFDA